MPSEIETRNDSHTSSAVRVSRSQVKKVAVIGAGASGSISLDTLLKENHFSHVTVFERRDKPGGIWCLDEDVGSIPQNVKAGASHELLDPPVENPFKEGGTDYHGKIIASKVAQERFEKTPSYKGLTTNITEKLMTFSDEKSWNVNNDPNYQGQDFVDGLVVQQYIQKYISRNLKDERVSFKTGVVVEDIEKVYGKKDSIPYYFRLMLRRGYNETFDELWQEDFDAVIVATGHYHIPNIPLIKGLPDVEERLPGKVQHAKFYRSPDLYAGKNVLVVGSRASGTDLAKSIAKKANLVYQSIRTPRASFKPDSYGIVQKPIVKKYEVVSSTTFKAFFDDGTESDELDYVIYGTGYQFSFPFLDSLYKESGVQLIKDGTVITDLFQHTFAISQPLLAFVGMPIDGISFRVFEYQAILVSRYLAGKVEMPNRAAMNDWVFQRLQQKGITRAYHTIGITDAFEYIDTLVQLGHIKDPKLSNGRQFPDLDKALVNRFYEEKLKAFWDDGDIQASAKT
ncbi:Piso0_005219 [Millerozyma farinosa CBS 7064]|uniref:Piso0_005219 protein n=1 Tax=Pichia sorbitophila (strain ATCC MYA-4447 / BCRC 22081 / CBS 7064 / NBRC 10061 / NRRL Y-12695) TaxID=559304 RepID=G8Y4I7_PICSO|nr:Piso0_005219 [Millerozyma farinosa CBS 7064]